MDVWQFIYEKLNASINIILLYVLDSKGSSPGRKDFKMAVAADNTFIGTIGGGIMEHKLVERAKSMLQGNAESVLLMQQYHDKEHNTHQSGMICSGSQLNAFIPLSSANKQIVEKILTKENLQKTIKLSPRGIQLIETAVTGLHYNSDEDWIYTEPLYKQPVIHIIGGGHVGLALSELMHYLGFYIKLYDDRLNLNTIAANYFANEKHIVDYATIGNTIGSTPDEYVVIMTIGYRTDKIVLKQLINKSFFYLGLLGSQHKIQTLFNKLKEEGISQESLDKVFSPIGLNISSKTTKEIAVSIAAEIIKEKNKIL